MAEPHSAQQDESAKIGPNTNTGTPDANLQLSTPDTRHPTPDTPTPSPDTEPREPIELLADDFVERCRRGEAPSIEQYASEHPEWAEQIRELFPTIAAMERLKTTKEKGSGRPAAHESITVERLGDLRILAEIGRGGMGIVYEAVQESLGRRVAVKVLPKQFLLDEKRLLRFRREARTAAKLHHTNIVPILGVGEHEGYHYYVMQYIRGVGLDEVIRHLGQSCADDAFTAGPCSSQSGRDGKVTDIVRALLCGEFPRADSSASGTHGNDSAGNGSIANDVAPSDNRAPSPGHESVPSTQASAVTVALTDYDTVDDSKSDSSALATPTSLAAVRLGQRYWRSVARIGVQAADALHYAHVQGTLHRDVKPANLLLDSHGVVWVADFGLAKAMEQEDVSRTGDIVGTLRYMAPEQFRAGADERSDIYSLGLTLYELLTLRPAFDDTARKRSLLTSDSSPELTRPRKLVPGIPRDLETIVLKAVSPEPKHRYQTACELAADLTCFLEDRPILAKRTSSIERLWRWCRRNRAVAALGATAAMLLVAVAAMLAIGYVKANEANVQIGIAFEGEKKQRKKAEATLGISLEALDKVTARFMPDQLARTESLTIEVDEGEELEIPARPVLSKENAALLEELLPFYDRLAEQYGDDARLGREAAKANRRVGDIQQRLGNFAHAAEAYDRAIAKYEELAEQEGDRGDTVAEIARIHNELGNVHLAMSNFKEAHASYLDAIRLLEPAVKASTASDQTRYELARTCYYLGRRGFPGARPGPPGPMRGEGRGPRSGRGAPKGPHPAFGRSGQAADRNLPVGRASSLPFAANSQARSLRHGTEPTAARSGPRMHGPSAGHRGDTQHLNRAIELLTELNERYPSVPDYRHLMALCLRESSTGLHSVELTRATEMLEEICHDFPNHVDYRFDLCETYARVEPRWPYPAAEDSSIAEDRLGKALEIADELAKKYPNEPAYMASQARINLQLAGSLLHKARLQGDQGKETLVADAEKYNRAALAIQSSLAQGYPDVTSYVIGLAIVKEPLARLLADRSEFAEARSLLESSIADLEQRLTTVPEQRFIRGMLFYNNLGYATVLNKMGEDELAAEVLQQATQMHGRSPHGKPRFGRGPRWGPGKEHDRTEEEQN